VSVSDRWRIGCFGATTWEAAKPMQAAKALTMKSLRRAWRPGTKSCASSMAPANNTNLIAVE